MESIFVLHWLTDEAGVEWQMFSNICEQQPIKFLTLAI